jgi:hypothetical protein
LLSLRRDAARLSFGTDPIEELTKLAEKIYQEFHTAFFHQQAHLRKRQLVYSSTAQ